jgi:YHS domain-containing protein
MTVNIDTATAARLTAKPDDVIYYFCGRGCKLEFGDNPAKYLDPN